MELLIAFLWGMLAMGAAFVTCVAVLGAIISLIRPEHELTAHEPVGWQARLDAWRTSQHAGEPANPSDSDSSAL